MKGKKEKTKLEVVPDTFSEMVDEIEDNEDDLNLGQLFRDQAKKKKSGGFQSMGFTYAVLKGVLKKGYKVPTPIQRKTIPIILEGKDVVAMARTGSGKTAAFLLPLFQRLKGRCSKIGARALILSPTRELAQQTIKFCRELGKFTGLRSAIVLGGDKMDDQFAAIHEHPDILIATPGRFLHVMMEMDLKLSSMEYVVFDEADRLFEMGFREQLLEILHRLPENRQTLLFSATLPRLLVDFAKAGLNDPVLVRLDTETKLSTQLKTAYLFCRSEDKFSILLRLLSHVVGKNQLTVVFFATKHHVEYAKDILTQAEITCSYIYSSLDQTARKIQAAKFHARKTNVLLVTDVAARGIDIPHLDYVINFNFPVKPKLFVHRVGRVARAGREGTAYSIVSPDETAYVLDLHLFLGHSVKFASKSGDNEDGVIGSVPQDIIDEEAEAIGVWHEKHVELRSMAKVCSNAYKLYIKSRPAASTESTKRMKEILMDSIGTHPIFKEKLLPEENERTKFLESMKSYRPQNTIFEVGATAKSQAPLIMRVKKKYHKKAIEKAKFSHRTVDASEEELRKSFMSKLPLVDEDHIKDTFKILGKRKLDSSKENVKKAKREIINYKDEEHYVKYQSLDHHAERGFEIDKSFNKQVSKEILDLNGDESTQTVQTVANKKWDRKKKKFINDPALEGRKKKILTESGALIPASYKSNAYFQWKEKNKVDQQDASDSEDIKSTVRRKGGRPGNPKSLNRRPLKRELKTKDEILKARKRRERLENHRKKAQGGKTKKKKMLKREKYVK